MVLLMTAIKFLQSVKREKHVPIKGIGLCLPLQDKYVSEGDHVSGF